MKEKAWGSERYVSYVRFAGRGRDGDRAIDLDPCYEIARTGAAVLPDRTLRRAFHRALDPEAPTAVLLAAVQLFSVTER